MGWDAPFTHTRKRWLETRNPAIIWEGHKAGREIPYCHMEKLCNLEQLPDDARRGVVRLGSRRKHVPKIAPISTAGLWPVIRRESACGSSVLPFQTGEAR